MIDDHQNLRAAELLISEYGENASAYAELRAFGLLADGDVDGAMVWRRIVAAVVELSRGRRKGEKLN
jgi:hypothetical protein